MVFCTVLEGLETYLKFSFAVASHSFCNNNNDKKEEITSLIVVYFLKHTVLDKLNKFGYC